MSGNDTDNTGNTSGNDNGSTGGGDSGGASGGDEVSKLRSINERLKGQLTDVEKRLQQFTSIYKDIDPDEAKSWKAEKERLERELASKDPRAMEEMYERKLNRVRQDYDAERTNFTNTIDGMKKELKTLKVTDRVMSEISYLFNKDALKFIKREVEELCDLDEDGTIVVKDENGDPIFRNGKYLGIKDFGEMLAEKYPSLAASSGVGGSKDATPGTRTNGRGNSGRIPESLAELNAMQNPREVLERLKKENPAAVMKILQNSR